MVSGIPSVGITQNELLLNYDTVLLGVRYDQAYQNDVLKNVFMREDMVPSVQKNQAV
jgi:hypothetical protein